MKSSCYLAAVHFSEFLSFPQLGLQEKKGSTSSGMQQLDRKLRNRATGSMAVETVPLCHS